MDDWTWVATVAAVVGTGIALWQLLKSEIKESEGRNRELIKESEGRNDKAHGELNTRINDGFKGLNATLMTMSNQMGFIRGWQERDERARPQSGERDQPPPGGDPTR